jgi:chemotaxis protein histidine kinase CheA
VQHHEGKMNIESKEGCGTTVFMEFPLNMAIEEEKLLEVSINI